MNHTAEYLDQAALADLRSDMEGAEQQAINGPFFPDRNITAESLKAYAAKCRAQIKEYAQGGAHKAALAAPPAMNLATLSATKLQALYDRRQAACSVNCSALIAAGRGMERGNEIYAKGKAQADSLSIDYATASDAVQEVIAEMERRKRYHGSLKPICNAA